MSTRNVRRIYNLQKDTPFRFQPPDTIIGDNTDLSTDLLSGGCSCPVCRKILFDRLHKRHHSLSIYAVDRQSRVFAATIMIHRSLRTMQRTLLHLVRYSSTRTTDPQQPRYVAMEVVTRRQKIVSHIESPTVAEHDALYYIDSLEKKN